MADYQREHEHRQELGEADESERERTMRDRIDLPADRDRHHLERYRRHHPRAPEQRKRTMTHDGAGGRYR